MAEEHLADTTLSIVKCGWAAHLKGIKLENFTLCRLVMIFF